MNNGTCKEGYNSENYCSCLPGFTVRGTDVFESFTCFGSGKNVLV